MKDIRQHLISEAKKIAKLKEYRSSNKVREEDLSEDINLEASAERLKSIYHTSKRLSEASKNKSKKIDKVLGIKRKGRNDYRYGGGTFSSHSDAVQASLGRLMGGEPVQDKEEAFRLAREFADQANVSLSNDEMEDLVDVIQMYESRNESQVFESINKLSTEIWEAANSKLFAPKEIKGLTNNLDEILDEAIELKEAQENPFNDLKGRLRDLLRHPKINAVNTKLNREDEFVASATMGKDKLLEIEVMQLPSKDGKASPENRVKFAYSMFTEKDRGEKRYLVGGETGYEDGVYELNSGVIKGSDILRKTKRAIEKELVPESKYKSGKPLSEMELGKEQEEVEDTGIEDLDVEYVKPFGPYIKDIGNTSEMALALADMTEDALMKEELEEFVESCDRKIKEIQEGEYNIDQVKALAAQANEVIADVIQDI